ncbi:MAG: hypothetical protein RJB38_796 [Pseudomonadota bacterium]
MHFRTSIWTCHPRLTLTSGLLLLGLGACSERPPLHLGVSAQPAIPQEVRFLVKGSTASSASEGAGPTANASAAFAEHGVSVPLQGPLVIGPAPNGQVHRQSLADQERQDLAALWTKTRSSLTAQDRCVAIAEASALAHLEARITILENDRETGLVRIDGGQICGPIDTAALEPFANALIALAKKHYPKRFPDECLAASDTLREAYSGVSTCEVDSDCAHVDPQLIPIPAGQLQYVPLKSCSILPILSAANAESLNSQRKALLTARETAKKVCEATQREQVCTAEADEGFQNHRHRARCEARACVPGKRLR